MYKLNAFQFESGSVFDLVWLIHWVYIYRAKLWMPQGNPSQQWKFSGIAYPIKLPI